MDQSSKSTGYIPEIDGLRALAVGAVIVFHLWPAALPGGFTGVDLFFVVSGFVVSRSLLEREPCGLHTLVLDFYSRRAVRILPALIVTLLATTLATQLFIPQAWLAPDPSHVGLAAFYGMANVVLMQDAASYFTPSAALNPFTHSWSLGVEEQFYLFFPFLLHWSTRRGTRPPTPWLIAGLSVGSLVLSAWLGTTYPKHAFYSVFSRFWELGTGVLLCLVLARDGTGWIGRRRLLGSAIAPASAAMIGAGFVLARPEFFPFPLALLPVLGAAGLIAAICAFPDTIAARVLRSRAAVSTGRLSYSLYLWHWPVFVLFRWTVGLERLPLQIGALAIAIALALALGSYQLVEQPLRARVRGGAPARARVLRIAIGATMLAYLIATLLAANHRRLSLSVTRDRTAWYAEPGHPLDPVLSHCTLRQDETSAAGGSRIAWSPQRCRQAARGSRIFVLGDSHGVAYTPDLRQVSAESGATVIVYFRAHCPFAELLDTMASRRDCRAFYKQALDEVRRSAATGDVIFLPGLRLHLPVEPGAAQSGAGPARAEHVPDAALAEARVLLRLLTGAGARVVFEAPKPVFRSSPFRCADWFNRNNPACRDGLTVARNDLLAQREPVIAAIEELADAAPGVSVWDPFDALCPRDPCRAMQGDRPLFFDSNHLSGYGNSILYPSLRSALVPVDRSKE